MIDLTKWFVMPLSSGSFGRETHHLEGTTLDGKAAEKAYHVDTGYSLKFVKSQQGWPVEIKPYDSQWIYDRTTENGWTSPNDFKQFNPMLAMCPRFWDGVSRGPMHDSSPFEFWQNCVKVKTSDYGKIKYEIGGPYSIDFRGDVGETDSIILRFFGNGNNSGYPDLEELYLTLKAGWMKWAHYKLKNGVYEIDAATLHNKIVAGGPPPINFPCMVIP